MVTIAHALTRPLITQGAIIAERQEILAELVQMKENIASLPTNINDIVNAWAIE